MNQILGAADIGIIGGADGPTAIFFAGGLWPLACAIALTALLGYLLGSLSFSVIVSKLLYHDDVRNHGSGNAGMTNILRTYGKGAAALTLIGDMGKGVAAVFASRALACALFGLPQSSAGEVFGANGFNIGALAAFFAVIGHLFPVFFHFKGGKGVAVASGCILAINPVVFLCLSAVFFLVVGCSRIVSLASILSAACYPVFTLVYGLCRGGHVAFNTICALLMAALVIWMHRENIKRLKNGTEYKFGQKKESQQ